MTYTHCMLYYIILMQFVYTCTYMCMNAVFVLTSSISSVEPYMSATKNDTPTHPSTPGLASFYKLITGNRRVWLTVRWANSERPTNVRVCDLSNSAYDTVCIYMSSKTYYTALYYFYTHTHLYTSTVPLPLFTHTHTLTHSHTHTHTHIHCTHQQK